MKLSELRPCDNCGGQIAPMFYLVRISHAMIDAKVANEVLGLTQMFQGHLHLAEVMGARPDDAVMILGEKDPDMWTELILCQNCSLLSNLNIGVLMEGRAEAENKQKETSDVDET